MAGRLPYITRRKYPHMVGDETKVWNRFVVKFPKRFDTVDYDFRVGEGMPYQEDWEDNIRRMVTAITQKRIDVVGWNGDRPTIIEVKVRAGLSALGQVLGYAALFRIELPKFPFPEMMIVCETTTADDLIIFENQSIPVEIV